MQPCAELPFRAAGLLSTPFPVTPAAPTVNQSPRERSELRSFPSISVKRLLPSRARSAGRNIARGRRHHRKVLATRASTRLREVGERSETDGSSPGNSTRVGFTGHQQDNDLGFTDMGGRVYDPLAGRFTTADPVMQAPFWSQGQNRYAYVFNDPINATDPSGFSAAGTGVGIGVGAAGYGTVAYGFASGSGFNFASLLPAGGPAGSVTGSGVATGLGVLQSLALTPGGPAANTSYQVATPTTAPTSSLNKANGAGSAPGQAQPPGPPKPRRVPKAAPKSPASSPAPQPSSPACDEMCRNAPNGAAQPSVNHDLLNAAVPQILDTHKAYDAAAHGLLEIAAAPVVGVVGKLASGAVIFLRASRAGYRLHGLVPNKGQLAKMATRELVELGEMTRTSIATRTAEMLSLGAKGGHANRLGDERRLLEAISEMLRGRGIP